MHSAPVKKSDAVRLARKQCASAPVIVLVRPTLSENVGACARAMLNFGLAELRLVEPRCDPLDEAAVRRAAGAEEVLRGAQRFASVAKAVADLSSVYATTARARDMTSVVTTPRSAAAAIAAAAPSDRAGVLYGPEASGLSNADLAHAAALIQIPTFEAFSSLNLSQAVNLFSYEWWQAHAASKGSGEGGGEGGAEGVMVVRGGQQLAEQGVLDALCNRLETALDENEFQPVPQHRESVYLQLRGMLSRVQMSQAEAGILHGVITSLTRGPKSARKGTKKGKNGG
ncbi:RNA methyltransferase, TrmH family, group 1 [Tribonema minus]|uniref:RNA methyltransferase, TrmH family, group 1 n=1 Tax=Tribonema minus TaxID=303371 RepID=A0A835ZGP2_9STRA|nr:RNA methyltransferase, TrmH family, group 1 [Tribonema minus]